MQPLPREPERREPERPIERPEAFRRPGERLEELRRPAPTMELRQDLVRWGPVFAGVIVALSTIILLSILGTAIGLAAAPTGLNLGTAAGIWTAIVMIIALFLGGWVAAATSAVGGRSEGALNGVMVWATLLFIGLFLSTIGAGALLGAMTQFGVFGAPAPAAADIVGAAWSTFIALLVGLGVAALGGYLGAHEEIVPGGIRF